MVNTPSTGFVDGRSFFPCAAYPHDAADFTGSAGNRATSLAASVPNGGSARSGEVNPSLRLDSAGVLN
jgi:hypothetical protein